MNMFFKMFFCKFVTAVLSKLWRGDSRRKVRCFDVTVSGSQATGCDKADKPMTVKSCNIKPCPELSTTTPQPTTTTSSNYGRYNLRHTLDNKFMKILEEQAAKF